jgi:DNA excision repair protein ERCC-2
MRLLRRWRTGTGYTLSHRCLDPSVYTADVLNSARSVIVMSGTLKPQEMYRDLLGLDGSRTELREYRSPFPRHNRLCLLVTGITTKYASRTEAEYARIAGKASEVLNAIPGNSAVFFPSFAVQRRILPLLNLARPVLAQKEKSSPAENTGMLAQFRQHAKRGGAVLAGVAGGSFSEGIDLPGEELLGVVVVGIPLGEPDLETQAMIDYYDCKYGRGWAYGYIYPAMSRAVQAGGRCIRNETDRGVVAFLDSRFAWENYSRCFPRDLDFTVTESPGEHVRRFWSILPSEEDKIH